MMDIHDDTLAPRFARLLAQREAQLSAILAGSDLKLEAATAENAALELEQVLAARHRLDNGTFGVCVDCGKPVGVARLNALPAAAYCVGCQSLRERDARPVPQH